MQTAERYLKCECPHCGQSIEYPGSSAGDEIDCPTCACRLRLPVPSGTMTGAPPMIPPPVIIQAAPEQPRRFGRIKTKGELIGGGCVLQLLGLCAIWFFPIGTILGIGLIIAGSAAARKKVCSECGATLNSRWVKLCPSCHAQFR